MAINRARIEHLESLRLPLAGKRVLDVGCGVGHLAQFFVSQGCDVTSVDARAENIAALCARYPTLKAKVVDIESERLAGLGTFDIVFCYGLFYHLENPIAALRNIASVCRELLLLETIVTDHRRPLVVMDEESADSNQALRGLGCRPTPSFVILVLSRIGFSYIYAPRERPDHRDFRFQWKNDLKFWREGRPLRCVFVASKTPLDNVDLLPLL